MWSYSSQSEISPKFLLGGPYTSFCGALIKDHRRGRNFATTCPYIDRAIDWDSLQLCVLNWPWPRLLPRWTPVIVVVAVKLSDQKLSLQRDKNYNSMVMPKLLFYSGHTIARMEDGTFPIIIITIMFTKTEHRTK